MHRTSRTVTLTAGLGALFDLLRYTLYPRPSSPQMERTASPIVVPFRLYRLPEGLHADEKRTEGCGRP